ncbi:MAG: molybdopterin-dependent oxidoreductase [Solirubrobacteraceae bacterium]
MGGVSIQTIVDHVEPDREAKWVVFCSLGEGADKGVYYGAHPIEHMGHHLTMLPYDMNDAPLPLSHGAPPGSATRSNWASNRPSGSSGSRSSPTTRRSAAATAAITGTTNSAATDNRSRPPCPSAPDHLEMT